jgi:cation:H+ antiporter
VILVEAAGEARLELMIYVQLTAGLALLFFGGTLLVRGAVSVATRARLSPLLIGLTLVGFGTSVPELLTSVDAALAGSAGIALGNVVGSNTANILLVLGLGAAIHPIEVGKHGFRRDGALVLIAALICVAVFLFGDIGRAIGVALVVLLLLYVGGMYWQESRFGVGQTAVDVAKSGHTPGWMDSLWGGLLVLLGGLAITIIGARLTVAGALEFAKIAGLSEAVVGLTIVAVGTSLPELVTSLIAAIRRETDIAFGNVIGSNVFNVLGILGATALVQPLTVPRSFIGLDIWIMLAATIVLVIFAVTQWRITRTEGAVLLASYAAYVGYLIAVAG